MDDEDTSSARFLGRGQTVNLNLNLTSDPHGGMFEFVLCFSVLSPNPVSARTRIGTGTSTTYAQCYNAQ